MGGSSRCAGENDGSEGGIECSAGGHGGNAGKHSCLADDNKYSAARNAESMG